MTLLEAIRTGLPFRRVDSERWKAPSLHGEYFSKTDVLSDIWEVQLTTCEKCLFYIRSTEICDRMRLRIADIHRVPGICPLRGA